MIRLDGMTDIDVIIVNYRSAAHTVNCVRAVHRVASGDGVNVRIVVVNNGDNDAAFEQTLYAAGDAMVVNNSTNAGFGAACNQGAALSTSEFILFLNPDATLQPVALKACLEALKNPADESLGIVGPKITDGGGNLVRSCSRLPTLSDLILRSMGVHTLFRDTGYPYLSRAAHKQSGDVGQVMGAALLIRRSLFQSLGGFDERYLLYYEDVDLCARAHAIGSRCYYLKEAHVTHIGRASSSQNTGLALALHIRSRLIYARLHFGRGAQMLLATTSLLMEMPIRLLLALLGGGTIGRQGVLTAYRLLLLNEFSDPGIRAVSIASRGRGA